MDIAVLKSYFRMKVPAAGKVGSSTAPITDANLLIILNRAALDIAEKTKALSTYATFDAVADQDEYNLSTLITDFLCPLDDNPLYFYDESEYTELDLITRGYLNKNHSAWLTDDSGNPERAFIEGDVLTVHPAPDSAITDGFLLWYVSAPAEMDLTTNIYPFGGTSEIIRLKPFQMILIDYAEWQAYEVLDINQPNSPRLGRAREKYLTNVSIMAGKIKAYSNSVLLKNKKTRLKVGTHYGINPF